MGSSTEGKALGAKHWVPSTGRQALGRHALKTRTAGRFVPGATHHVVHAQARLHNRPAKQHLPASSNARRRWTHERCSA